MLRLKLFPFVLILVPQVLGDQAGGHAHAVAVDPDPNAYYNQAAYDPAYGQYDPAYGQYDPKYAEAYGYPYDYSDSGELAEKQTATGTGPTALDFVPFLASFSLPLGAAVITFLALVSVAAAFLLFPQTVEIDTNSRKKRSFESLSSPYGVCDGSSSKVCRILESIVLSMDCLEVASCEVATLAQSHEFPMIADIVKPFISHNYYDRFAGVDCSTLKCKAKNSFYEKNRI